MCESLNYPAKRQLLIKSIASAKNNTNSFYQKINSKLVKKVKSDKKGMYSVTLPMGYYSLFTKEEKGFYANLFDDAMNINPVQVRKGKWAKFEFVIDYQAVY